MNRQHPVYTVENECQDCNKCVRECLVKAIKVQDGHAAVIPERCVACGHCVTVCPARAKKVRDDLGRARHLIQSNKPIYVSLAPSWMSEFPELSADQMIASLKKLGFNGVGETASGAQEISAATADWIRDNPPGLWLSSACPAAVEYISKFLPNYRSRIMPLASPAIAHSKLLRRAFGDEIIVIFIGPCIAKKLEADRHPDDIQLALTFQDLRKWWKENGIDPEKIETTQVDRFVPQAAQEGALYPLAGGMLETLQGAGIDYVSEMFDVAGLDAIEKVLGKKDISLLKKPVFIECLACKGGCIQGPSVSQDRQDLLSALEVRKRANLPAKPVRRETELTVEIELPKRSASLVMPEEKQLQKALNKVGKKTPDDELNCGGCGYDTCRNFATALLRGDAEAPMCVSYMRKIAQRKANALLRCIPSGVVIADSEMRVIECNLPFATMFGEDAVLAFEAQPGLEGALLSKILPFENLFKACLRTGEDIERHHVNVGQKLLDIVVFSIEQGKTIGAVIQDVTDVEMHREQIANRAREVIQKNMQTVQKIACQLGEHMADTEILLSSIASDYGPDKNQDREENNGNGGGKENKCINPLPFNEKE